MRGARHHNGFSLIEILVAFVILAMSLTVLFRIFSGGLRNVSLAQDYARAELLAESQMSELSAFTQIEPGITTGEWGQGYTWERSIEPYQPWQQKRRLNAPIEAYKITVTVTWRHARGDGQISLNSVRLQTLDSLSRRI